MFHPIHTSRGVSVLGGDTSAASIGGLQFWLEADRLTGADGASVVTWTDISSTGNDFVSLAAGNRPTLQTNELNSLPVVRFDGTDDFLLAENTLSLSAFTLVLVAKIPTYDGVTFNTRGLFSWAPAASLANAVGGFALLIDHDAAGLQMYAASATNDLDASAAVDAGWHLIVVAADATSGQLYVDGTQVATDTTANAGYTLTELALGGYVTDTDTVGLTTESDYAFVALYNSKLSATHRGILTNTLGAKYGLTVA